MRLESLANEYMKSAELLKERVNGLKKLQKTKNFEEQQKIEDRIVLLDAEYYHLLNIAAYLNQYYEKSENCNQLEV
ncbi:hypothetical protein RBG61_05500 [Paludicola sp. MB14-C6]|uniref:hypothetical protein n=1 Tax=Paludihabitans sp. MB14-C6 TaxID=3070656 RepID=UPI0027DB5508|nr:hypothetical protein [Paludicola sp. MB14-C6]WMJ24120.1 hypothetical protein RBG61_05500 [Paludicola sp. MB14-C6]